MAVICSRCCLNSNQIIGTNHWYQSIPFGIVEETLQSVSPRSCSILALSEFLPKRLASADLQPSTTINPNNLGEKHEQLWKISTQHYSDPDTDREYFRASGSGVCNWASVGCPGTRWHLQHSQPATGE